MHTLGLVISFCAFVMMGTLILRGTAKGLYESFPLYYSYIAYSFAASLVLYAALWLFPVFYARAYWFNYLINVLAEFAVLVEISDHIFRPFVLIRNLGRALTVLITAGFGLFYILPAVLFSTGRSRALPTFVLRASVTKAVILVVLLYMAKHYGSHIGRNLGGLMLGFSLYVALNVAVLASRNTLSVALFAPVVWVVLPLASALCILIWTICLWQLEPVQNLQPISNEVNGPHAVALELTRFNSELSKILHK
jgi:hypothetical protein